MASPKVAAFSAAVQNNDDNIRTRKLGQGSLDDIEDLAGDASGTPTQKWLMGAGLAAVIIGYGIVWIARGHTTLFGRHSYDNLDFDGPAGQWLAVAYVAIGLFIHFHYFWGLSERLHRFSQAGKIIAALLFIPSFFYALYRFFF